MVIQTLTMMIQLGLTLNFNMKASEWLDKNEWDNKPIESVAWSHYTMLDTLMEEYAKHYMKERLTEINKTINVNKFI